jgi:hypothetical protein
MSEPGDAEAVDVEEPVAGIDGLFLIDVVRVREELGEIVIVDLTGERVFGSDEYVFEQAVLRW